MRGPRLLTVVERTGQALCLVVPAVTASGTIVWWWWAAPAGVALAGYYLLWVRYLRVRTPDLLYRAAGVLPVPMAVLPVVVFLAAGAWLGNPWIAASAVVLAAGHIPASMRVARAVEAATRVDLWWLPVGAGGRVVAHTSGWWEWWRAWRERRRPQPLFHSALEVFVDGRRHVIEMTPAWGQPVGERGVVAVGPVGRRPLGRFRLFRYEVRCWEGGELPDRAYAVDSPVSMLLPPTTAHSLIAAVGAVPPLTWGAQQPRTGDMWNSNSLISWLLTTSGVDATRYAPPVAGRAPGWVAGIAVAKAAAPTP